MPFKDPRTEEQKLDDEFRFVTRKEHERMEERHREITRKAEEYFRAWLSEENCKFSKAEFSLLFERAWDAATTIVDGCNSKREHPRTFPGELD